MCVQYWPPNTEKNEEYGGIGVSVLKEEELANFHIRTIKLYKKDENGVNNYLYKIYTYMQYLFYILQYDTFMSIQNSE